MRQGDQFAVANGANRKQVEEDIITVLQPMLLRAYNVDSAAAEKLEEVWWRTVSVCGGVLRPTRRQNENSQSPFESRREGFGAELGETVLRLIGGQCSLPAADRGAQAFRRASL